MESGINCLFYLVFSASAALSTAHVAFFDDYWQSKTEAARHDTFSAYVPDPASVVNHFNSAENGTRRGRGLAHRAKMGGCSATNPIDRCWRCHGDWMNHRKKLAKCAQGFGHDAGGGVRGKFYVVTDSSDDDLVDPRPGTLRYGVTRDAPLWIVFARDMVIRLRQELMINSYKTVDARGANMHIAYGAGLTVQFVKNVIIDNLHIHDIKPASGGNIRDSETHWGICTASDGVSIFGSSHVWVDHLSMSNCADGLIDVIQGSTAITISNCHFTRHNDVILLGASDSHSDDAKMQVTVAYNHFGRGLAQRMPRCRWGFLHVGTETQR